ncbi:hypothetical protein MTO96_032158 [Rhipicephalus appendiculatus]
MGRAYVPSSKAENRQKQSLSADAPRSERHVVVPCSGSPCQKPSRRIQQGQPARRPGRKQARARGPLRRRSGHREPHDPSTRHSSPPRGQAHQETRELQEQQQEPLPRPPRTSPTGGRSATISCLCRPAISRRASTNCPCSARAAPRSVAACTRNYIAVTESAQNRETSSSSSRAQALHASAQVNPESDPDRGGLGNRRGSILLLVDARGGSSRTGMSRAGSGYRLSSTSHRSLLA